MEKTDKLATYKIEIRSILLSYQKGCNLTDFNRAYFDLIGKKLPFQEMGYSTEIDFLYAMPDVVRIKPTGHNTYHLTGVADDKTKHIEDLVARQRPPKLRIPFRFRRRFRQRRTQGSSFRFRSYSAKYEETKLRKKERTLPNKGSLRAEVIALVQKFKNKVAVLDLPCEYKRMYFKNINLSAYGFFSVEEFIYGVPELEIVEKNNIRFVCFQSNEKTAPRNAGERGANSWKVPHTSPDERVKALKVIKRRVSKIYDDDEEEVEQEFASRHTNTRLLRFKRRRVSNIDDDSDDEFAARHAKTRFSRYRDRYHHQWKEQSSRSPKRVRSWSSDSDPGHRKVLAPRDHRQFKRYSPVKRVRSYSSDDSGHRKQFAPERESNFKKRRTWRRETPSWSDDSEPRRPQKNTRLEKGYRLLKKSSMKKRLSPCSDSNPRHQKKKRVAEKRISDIEFLGEKVTKIQYCRFESKECKQINYYYEKSGRYIKEGRVKKALKSINVALTMCDNKVEKEFVSKLYSRRGIIYSILDRPRSSFQGFLDFEHAYILNKNNREARKKMSRVLYQAANRMYRMKEYKKGLIPCCRAIDLDGLNIKASKLSRQLKKKINEEEITKKVDVTTAVASSSNVKKETILSSNLNVDEEILRLYKLTAESVKNSNLLRALILVKQALRLYYDSENQDDKVFRKLFVLKQGIASKL